MWAKYEWVGWGESGKISEGYEWEGWERRVKCGRSTGGNGGKRGIKWVGWGREGYGGRYVDKGEWYSWGKVGTRLVRQLCKIEFNEQL